MVRLSRNIRDVLSVYCSGRRNWSCVIGFLSRLRMVVFQRKVLRRSSVLEVVSMNEFSAASAHIFLPFAVRHVVEGCRMIDCTPAKKGYY